MMIRLFVLNITRRFFVQINLHLIFTIRKYLFTVGQQQKPSAEIQKFDGSCTRASDGAIDYRWSGCERN